MGTLEPPPHSRENSAWEVTADPRPRPHPSLTLGLQFRPSRPFPWEDPLEHSGDRGAWWALSLSLGRTAFLCPPCTPSTSTSALADRVRAQRPASAASGQHTRGALRKLAGALPSAPPGAPPRSGPAPRSPSVRPGPHPCRRRPPGPARAAHACPPAEAPLNGPHRGPPAACSCCTPIPALTIRGSAQALPFPRDFLWPPS